VGWLLGITLPACSGPGGSRLVLRKTTDGGRQWSPVPGPPTSWGRPGAGGTAGGVSQVRFADPRNGWAFGPGLWATHDGGASWHQVATHGALVDSLEVMDDRVIAAFTPCGAQCGRPEPAFAVYTSLVARDDWRPVAGATGYGYPQVVMDGGTGYAVSRDQSGSRGTLLGGPADGSARWQPRPLPCAAKPAAAASGAGLVLACAALGTHPTPAQEYRSTDDGRTWQRLTSLLLFDGVDTISISPRGAIIIAGAYSGLLMSWDDGRTWHGVPLVDHAGVVEGGGSLEAAMTTSHQGFAIAAMAQIWFTYDAGHTWTPVTIQ
jgi:photosystem II stability/assembly factor-like uncharacterized protein